MEVNGQSEPFSPRPAFVLPGETIALSIDAEKESIEVELIASAGTLVKFTPRRFAWKAPQEAGMYPLVFRDTDNDDMQTVNVFVMRPYSDLKKGKLNGYRIGTYPKNHLPGYEHPRGFVEVTEESQYDSVSPHFQIKQFLCKQPSAFPKYLALSGVLVSKLERLLDKRPERMVFTGLASRFSVAFGPRSIITRRAGLCV